MGAVGAMRPMRFAPLVRIATVAAGVLAIAWALTAIVVWPRQAMLERLAEKIVRGEAFTTRQLEPVVPLLRDLASAPPPRASDRRSVALALIRLAEAAVAEGERQLLEEALSSLGPALDGALAARPTDGYLWLARFWYANARDGFSPAALAWLAASYRYGPREGWIALRRCPLALTVFHVSDEPAQERTTREFAGLVAAGFPEAVDMSTGPGWPVRERLLASLVGVDEPARRVFSRALLARGHDLRVPGIARPDARPWSR